MTNIKRKHIAITALSMALIGCTMGGGITALTQIGVRADGEVLPDPVAKYMFDDADNIGKDSVGGYDMEIVGGKNEYTPISGGIEFNGNFAMAQKVENNIFKDLTEFTMCFEYKMLPGNSAWKHLIGVNNAGGGNYLYFNAADGGGQTRMQFYQTGGDWGGVNLNACSDYTKVTLTVKPGGRLKVYLNGVDYDTNGPETDKITSVTLPADWSLYNEAEGACRFSIGAPVSNGSWVGDAGKAGVKEIVFYNKEFTAAEVAQYWTEYDAAHPTFASCELDFSENVRVSSAASVAHVLKSAPNGIYEATLSNGSKANVAVTWNNVVQKDDGKYLEGTISGVNNPEGLKAYAKIAVTEAKVVSAEVDSGAVIINETTDAQLMALVQNGDYEVTLEDNTKMTATIAWTEVKEENGKRYIEGTISEVNNPDGVKAKGLVTVGGETVLAPFAHYEFKNSRAPGEDSTGNYNMTAVGTPKANRDQEGVFDGKSGLAVENSFTTKLKSFSLSFEILKEGGENPFWATPIGLGIDGGQWLSFNFAKNDNLLRFAMSTKGGSAPIAGGGNECWGAEVGNVSDAEFSKVVLTVEAGGLCHLYFNGTEIKGSPYNVPEDFAFTTDSIKLALGYDVTKYPAEDRFFTGKLKDVRLYDCALTPGQVAAFDAYGKVFPHDNSLYIKSVSDTVKFANDKVTTETLFDTMNAETMLGMMNAATVTATLTDNSTKDLNVTWTGISQTGNTYVAKGMVEAVGIGATVVPAKEITQELTVYKTLNVTVAEAENGSVSTDVQTAKFGDTVTITVTPAEGYLIEAVTVNGNALEGNEGVYTYTVGAEDTEIAVAATFKADKKKGGCGAAADSLLAVLASATLIAAAAVVFAKKSKKNN